MTGPNLLPAVIAGARVSHAAQHHGRMGLIVVTPQREILGLTVTTVVPDGKHAIVQAAGSSVRSGLCRRLTAEGEADSPVSSLICGIPFTGPICVRSEFAGLEAARYPEYPRIDEGSLFLLRGQQHVFLGGVVASGATVYRQCGETRSIYYGALEIELPSCETLRDGDAGAAVVSDEGIPIGLLVGEKDGLAVVAPLAPLFRVAQLKPLSVLEASRHLGLAIQMIEKKVLAELITQEVDKPNHPDLVAPEVSRRPSSDELLRNSSDILDMAA